MREVLISLPQTIDYGRLVIAFAILWFAQALLAIRQNKKIAREFNDIQQTNTGYLGVGVQRAKFNLGSGVILALVVGFDDLVADFRMVQGMSILNTFKKYPEYVGLTIEEARASINPKKKKIIKAFDQAVVRITAEREKQENQD